MLNNNNNNNDLPNIVLIRFETTEPYSTTALLSAAALLDKYSLCSFISKYA